MKFASAAGFLEISGLKVFLYGAEIGGVFLELHDVRKAFNGHAVLDGLSLEVPRGGIVGIGGRNAAGKSTLLRLCAGLLRPDRGTVRVGALGAVAARRRGAIAWSGEAGGRFQRRLSLRANLRYAGSWSGAFSHAIDREIDRLSERFGIASDLDVRADACSQGMLQRAGLVRILTSPATLALLDEPTSAVDPDSTDDIHRGLTEELRALGRTALWVSHQPRHVAEHCSGWLTLREGRLTRSALERAA